ncbi:MAG: hypothetical protein C0606_12925 [Hyphomicrobiales bacterium]|nr:MAG: hypothetical protein C0606_12925 [Hyphomicrobiales bacterium]
MTALFDDYCAGFNDFDPEAIIDCFTFPATIWQFDKGYVFDDEEDLAENIDALLAALDKEEVVSSEYAVVKSHVSGPTALVTLDWRQFDGEGEPVFVFTCHYHLIHEHGEWLIAMIINEDE